MTDIWVCSTCHSINRQRDSRCYKCGAKQETATGALADTRSERAIQARTVVAYKGSLLRGIIAGAFILAVAVLGIIVLNESLDGVRYFRDQIPTVLQTGELDEAELARRVAGALVPSLLRLVCAIGALLFFAAWLSRVVANIPALGGGTPAATPSRAFIYPLIPIWNLFKTPPIIQEALYRLDPKAGGFFMILVAWIGLVGSWLIGFVLGWWVDLRVTSSLANAQTLGDAIAEIQSAYDLQVIIDVATTFMVSAGAIVLVLVMFRIESRARARDGEIRAAFAASLGPAAPSPAPASAPPAPIAVSAAAADAAPAVPTAPPYLPDPAAPPLSVDPSPALPPPDAEPEPTPGLQLHIRVAAGSVRISLDGLAWEPSSLDELREAVPALRDAGGSAHVAADDDAEASLEAVGEIVSTLRSGGVPVAIAQG